VLPLPLSANERRSTCVSSSHHIVTRYGSREQSVAAPDARSRSFPADMTVRHALFPTFVALDGTPRVRCVN
jgi:hypothetical protein